MSAMVKVLASVVAALDQAGIGHMISGSIASARYGEARATQDIDIVIDPSAHQMEMLLPLLAETGMYVGDGSSALQSRSQFNVIDSTSGWKVDLIIRRDREYSLMEFDRRQRASLLGVEVFLVTPEDSILSKLEWASASGSERQLRDVVGLLKVQGSTLDWTYLEEWSQRLEVQDVLESSRLLAEG